MAAVSSGTGPDLEPMYRSVREQFEYFKCEDADHPAFMENAGGSQVPRCVVDGMAQYMLHSYAQLGAGHRVSERATATVTAARQWMRVLMNAPEDAGDILLGPSTSGLMHTLAGMYQQVLQPGHEVVLQELSHESNISPWLRMAGACGATVKWWRMPAANPKQPDAAAQQAPVVTGGGLCGLQELLGPATRLVAVTHASNLLGEVLDIQAVVACVRRFAPAARVVVDGVAYAPHRCLDMLAWGVDYYVFSAYKVYGPHMAVTFASKAATSELLEAGAVGPNFYFVPASNFAYKSELGGVSHEGCAGLLALQPYLAHVARLAAAPAQQQQQQQQDTTESQGPATGGGKPSEHNNVYCKYLLQ